MNLQIQRRRFVKWSGLGLGLGALLGRPAAAAMQSVFVDLALTPSGRGGWMLDLMGNVTPFGDAPVFSAPPDPDRPLCVAVGATPSGFGLYALTQDGNLRTWGDALLFDTSAARSHYVPFVDMAITRSGDGLWALDLFGEVVSFGAAPVFVAPPEPDRPVFVALGASPTGGLHALTQNGAFRTFGRGAPPFDTVAALSHRIPFVDMALTPSGDGLWALDLLGKVFSFGAAPVFNDPPDPDKPVFVALGASPSSSGLYALTQEGHLKTWGDFGAPV